MNIIKIVRSIIVIFSLVIPFLMVGSRPAFSQCSTLCMHERGNPTGVSAPMLAPSYQVVSKDDDEAGVDTAGENLQLAADKTNVDTVYFVSPSDKWRFAIIPYLWLMGINGKTTIKGRSANLDVSFGDIWDNLDFAAEVHLEAWKDRYGFFIDTSFAKIALKKNVDLRFDNTLNTQFVTKFFLGEFGGFYRVGTWAVGGGDAGRPPKTSSSLTFDLIGGGRYWYLKNELDLSGPLGVLPSKITDSQSWFDFIVGGRANLAINKFFIQVRSDVGGFGLGFSSDISWNIAGYIGYELSWYHITPIIGYRALYDKYKHGNGDNRFVWDAWITGPQVGIAFQF
jgi:hypothetical protein